MSQQELISLAKELKITDDRELFAKVVVSYSEMSKALNIAFGQTTGAGSDGFIGVYKDQLVCYTANTLGTKPVKERARISFEFIESHEIKKGALGLNNQFLIKTSTHQLKLYFRGKRKEMIEAINQAISKKTVA